MMPLSDDRYKMVDKTMKKLNYDKSALIETLHTAQETFGYLENETLKFIARNYVCLIPKSMVSLLFTIFLD